MTTSMNRHWRWLVALGAVFVPAAVMGAGTLPFSFSAGTPIRAAEVNANFDALRTRLDALEGATPAMAPVIGTLTMPGLEPIPIHSLAFAVTVSGIVAGGGGGAGIPQLSDLQVIHELNTASPTLNVRVNTGQHMTVANVVVGDLAVRLNDVIITGVAVGGARDQRPLESLLLSFAQIEWSWQGGVRISSYNRAQNIGSGPNVQSLAFAFFGTGVTPDPAFVPILEYAHSMQLPCNPFTGGGGGACKVTHAPISIQKRIDAATIDHLGLAVTGRHVQNLDLRWQRTTNELHNRVQLSDVVVSGVRLNASGDGSLVESVDFSYRQIRWTTGAVMSGWDVAANLAL
jgi:type VI secretion system secreted protein Hcp